MKNTLISIAIGGSLLALAGCHKDMMAVYNHDCTMYGFKAGTLEFSKCIQREADQHQAKQDGRCYIAHPLIYDNTENR
ncbi:MAG TPA: hypothetical protein VJB02_01550 [Coxiellaceae bacterium]|nr:hypothetical protein [Coxiellaceae bacterium]